MVRNIRLLVAYDGTEFHGWQRQPDLRTVQGCIEYAARRVVRHNMCLVSSGRTDAGVHAAGHVANFLTICEMPARNLLRAIGERLPKDLTLARVDEAPLGFHATRCALGKLYRYRIYNTSGRPVECQVHRHTFHVWHSLDLDRMRAGAKHYIGRQDFAAMASKGDQRGSTVRTVRRCDVQRHLDEVRIDVIGDGFLYNQVRNMVGTLIEVGRGHWQPDRVRDILDGRDRFQAGPTAPAKGLCLQWVQYPPDCTMEIAPEDVEQVWDDERQTVVLRSP